ncbi:MAG: TfoX/Sxy family protein [Alphaproteobacteria bacterium]|nr:TfoX/Sxy family protein [Alphaproteobacteria bacterium]
MAYDEFLAERFRAALGKTKGVSEKRMMGGVCFLLNGNMVGGADRAKDGQRRFMFRVGKDNAEKASALQGGEPMMQGRRRMTGLYFVAEEACSDDVMQSWLDLAVSFAKTLPPK